jgi:uncharacterized protein YqiB (DUF1249 family)
LRYKVDLKRFMADCEANYARLRRLFPAMDSRDHHGFALADRGDRHFVLRVLERSPYTSLIEVAERAPGRRPWLWFPAMRVRLYHDARLAEVVGFDGVGRVRPRNPYPNKVMHQPDEKAQWNRFLAEWLSMAMGSGYAVGSPHAFVD